MNGPTQTALQRRQGRVACLASQGVSTRTIAAQLGISQSAVVRDIRATGARDGVDTVLSRDGRQRPARAPRAPRINPARPVLAAQAWTSNGHLIADVARVGWLRPHWRTLDPTYGRGVWWRVWRPETLVVHDLALDGVDFRALPHADGSFDAICFDPPYVTTGPRHEDSISSVNPFRDRYGLWLSGSIPEVLQADLINPGLSEVARVVRPGGIVLVKCQDYVSGNGLLWPGTHHTLSHALSTGLRLRDRFELVRRRGPIVKPGRQVHARRNVSTLLVLQRRR